MEKLIGCITEANDISDNAIVHPHMYSIINLTTYIWTDLIKSIYGLQIDNNSDDVKYDDYFDCDLTVREIGRLLEKNFNKSIDRCFLIQERGEDFAVLSFDDVKPAKTLKQLQIVAISFGRYEDVKLVWEIKPYIHEIVNKENYIDLEIYSYDGSLKDVPNVNADVNHYNWFEENCDLKGQYTFWVGNRNENVKGLKTFLSDFQEVFNNTDLPIYYLDFHFTNSFIDVEKGRNVNESCKLCKPKITGFKKYIEQHTQKCNESMSDIAEDGYTYSNKFFGIVDILGKPNKFSDIITMGIRHIIATEFNNYDDASGIIEEVCYQLGLETVDNENLQKVSKILEYKKIDADAEQLVDKYGKNNYVFLIPKRGNCLFIIDYDEVKSALEYFENNFSDEE